MEKLCFFTVWREDSETVGINMKIRNQVKAFSNLGYDSYLCVSASSVVNLYHYNRAEKNFDKIEKREFSRKADHLVAKNRYLEKLSSFFRLNECLTFMDEMDVKFHFNIIYIRRVTPFTNGTALKINKWSKNSQVFWEIPTWGETPVSLVHKISYYVENHMYKKLKGKMKIVAISSGQERKGDVILINNGVDNENIPVKKNCKHNGINLICLATFSYWHGYDRLINGLNDYYNSFDSEKDIPVDLYMVGNGYIDELKKQTEVCGISEHVHFEGVLMGERLNYLFDKMDVAIGNLGFFRKGVISDTSIKIREYCARGIPFVTALKVNDFPTDFPYLLQVPMDESNISIEDIVQFYTKCHTEKTIKDMRAFSEQHLTWEQQLAKIFV